jgi:CelD/BcsL family acetyltransferase involved in cellulose biosynthesis
MGHHERTLAFAISGDAVSDREITLIGPDGLRSLRRQWERLWNEVPNASPFQSPAWLLPWGEIYAPERLIAAALWKRRRLAALVPAFIWKRELLLGGTGPSDHASPLCAPGAEEAVPDLVRVLTAFREDEVKRIHLQQLPQGSPFATAELDGMAGTVEPGDPDVVLALGDEDGMANVPKAMRSNWRYSVRRLEREGATIDLVPGDQAAEAVADLKRLHSIRWGAKGEEGVLSGRLASYHLRHAIPQLGAAGLLRMHRVRLGAEAVGILFAMRGATSTCYYLSGFDPRLAKLSLGTALVGIAIARAAAEGCNEFDFLRGQEDYKYRWGAKDRPMFRRIIDVPAQARAAVFA